MLHEKFQQYHNRLIEFYCIVSVYDGENAALFLLYYLNLFGPLLHLFI